MDILLEKKSIFLLWINHFIHLETLPRQKFSSSYSLEPFQLVQSISNKIGLFHFSVYELSFILWSKKGHDILCMKYIWSCNFVFVVGFI